MNSTKPTYTSSSPDITCVWLSARINHQQYGTTASHIFFSLSLYDSDSQTAIYESSEMCCIGQRLKMYSGRFWSDSIII